MSKVGIIPAAGKSERWGGIIKELLPVGPYERLIDQALNAFLVAEVDRIVIVTNAEKIAHLASFLQDKLPFPVHYVLQRGDNDIWSAIETSFDLAGDLNLFAMPDTIIPLTTFYPVLNYQKGIDFFTGTFTTRRPERFGVFHGEQIVNKDASLPKGVYQAWGVLAWSKKVVEFWQRQPQIDYTDAINNTWDKFPRIKFPLDFYFDMASWEDYRAFIADIGKTGVLQRQNKIVDSTI
jgi:dTDP-glucose pyrophosphorylase